MAHFLALEGSRFKRSHQHSIVPVHGLESMLNCAEMTMSFKMVDGETKAYHRAMDYIHRPVAFEDMCVYYFYEHVEVVKKQYLDKEKEYFDLQDDHPLKGTYVAIYRERKAVPTFGWHWLPSTKDLGSMLEYKDEYHPFFGKRETYCRRFLILFHPFRSADDLVAGVDSLTHQNRFREVINSIDPEMLQVANNIQDIGNSMNSKMPDNLLLSSTELEEEINRDKEKQNDESDDGLMDHLMGDLATYLASSSQSQEGADMEERTKFEPSFANYSYTGQMDVETGDAFGYEEESDSHFIPNTISQDHDSLSPRFQVSTQQLNSLLLTNQVGVSSSRVDFLADGSAGSIVEFGRLRNLDPNQQLAFQIIVATYVLTFYDEALDSSSGSTFVLVQEEKPKLKMLAKPRDPTCHQRLRLLVTGPAGAGKSAILESMIIYCRKFSREIGHIFEPNRTIVMSSLTGSSAMSIGGDTTARRFGLRMKSNVRLDDIRYFEDTRLCIVDEVGFMDYDKDLAKLNERLRGITQNRVDEPFGDMNIVFLGDFHQLEPVGGNALYNHQNSLHWEQALNCMVELEGTHRFRNCPLYSAMMPEIREGKVSKDMRELLNTRYVDGVKVKLPKGGRVKFATFYNKERAEINASVFRDCLKIGHSQIDDCDVPKNAIIIRSRATWARNNNPLTPAQHQTLYEECNESQIKDSNRKRADPFLCLFKGGEVMLTENTDVSNGIANGTTALFRKAVLKQGRAPTPIQMHGYYVYSVDIDDVDYLLLEWLDCEPYFTGTFRIHPKNGAFNVKFPIKEFGERFRVNAKVNLTYFPILLNTATTGHKLQGKSVDILVVSEWSKLANWAYVVLSRVRTLNGLFLLRKVPHNIDFAVNENCTRMEDNLRRTILVTPSV
jgi:hypothetical protein